jgi:hypothetical protein
MYTQTNIGSLCCVGCGYNVAVPLDRATTGIGVDLQKYQTNGVPEQSFERLWDKVL